MSIFGEQWEAYRQSELPDDMNPIALEQFRQAFWGGACLLYLIMRDKAKACIEDPAEFDRWRLELQSELYDFAKSTLPTPGHDQHHGHS